MEQTDKKIFQNTVNRQVDVLLMQQQFSLDERRERYDEMHIEHFFSSNYKFIHNFSLLVP